MAKSNNTPVRISQPADLVVVQMGYWGKYVMPVDAATQIMSLMVKSGAAKVEEEQGAYIPTRMDVTLTPLDKPFIDDVPVEGPDRNAYKAWIKTKRGIIGDGYVPEPFSVFLKAKEES